MVFGRCRRSLRAVPRRYRVVDEMDGVWSGEESPLVGRASTKRGISVVPSAHKHSRACFCGQDSSGAGFPAVPSGRVVGWQLPLVHAAAQSANSIPLEFEDGRSLQRRITPRRCLGEYLPCRCSSGRFGFREVGREKMLATDNPWTYPSPGITGIFGYFLLNASRVSPLFTTPYRQKHPGDALPFSLFAGVDAILSTLLRTG